MFLWNKIKKIIYIFSNFIDPLMISQTELSPNIQNIIKILRK
jgi:hypothetical protein